MLRLTDVIFNMPAKSIFKVDDFLALLHIPPSTGEISKKLKCNRGTVLTSLKKLIAKKRVIEIRSVLI